MPHYSTLKETFPSVSAGLKASVTLNNGVKMPWLGLGVWQVESDRETERVVRFAIEQGYRSIDTAKIYGNERGVGNAIRSSGVSRDQLFITTKLWNEDMRRDRVEAAFNESLKSLQLDYVDLYLLHWPIKGKITSTWKVVEKLQRSGRVKAIGVSNFMIPHLDELLPQSEIVPAVNQIEHHPYLRSQALLDYCRSKNIQVEAWSPLMQGGEVLRDPVIQKIAEAHRKTPAQVVLRWDLQNGVVTIPKSVKEKRMIENAAVFDFVLSPDEMKAIDALDRGTRAGPDPMNFNF